VAALTGVDEISLPQACRLAVAAQGLAGPRPAAEPGLRQVRGVCERLGVVQIDSVSVLVRSHYLPLFSRLGPYDRGLLERLAYTRPRRLFETWAHEASYVPVGLEPALRWRKAAAAGRREKPASADRVLAAVGADGPLAASDLEKRTGAGTWWNWSDTKRALEWLFAVGLVLSPSRRGSFERLYDVPERVLPREVLETPTPSPDDARKLLLLRAADALGVATAADLADWYRLRLARPLVAELVEAGDLVPVRVRGWRDVAYRRPGVVLPRRAGAAALLSPFDNLVFFRPRVERLWGLRLRLEIYTPAEKRVHGYYVLPFLLGDALVARLDVKRDRAAGVLRVLAAHLEPGAAPDAVVEPLAAELRLLAGWLDLASVEVAERGDLAPRLRAALRGDPRGLPASS